MTAGGEEVAGCLNGTGHDRGQVHPLLAEGQLALPGAAEMKHIFNDPRHVPSLALRGVARMPSHRLVNAATAHGVQGEHDRRERVAKLVRQERYQRDVESISGLPELGL